MYHMCDGCMEPSNEGLDDSTPFDMPFQDYRDEGEDEGVTGPIDIVLIDTDGENDQSVREIVEAIVNTRVKETPRRVRIPRSKMLAVVSALRSYLWPKERSRPRAASTLPRPQFRPAISRFHGLRRSKSLV